jgi:hypothetical protein
MLFSHSAWGCGGDDDDAQSCEDSSAPSNHSSCVGGAAHKPGLDTPEANCTQCHGDDLGGSSELGTLSCTACHGAIWK